MDNDIIAYALKLGFAHAAVIDAKELVYVPQYRKYCEENLCGHYDEYAVCPPRCGSAEEMHQRMLGYGKVLVLQTEFVSVRKDVAEFREAQAAHNFLLEQLLHVSCIEGRDILVMSSGPWKQYSCMSAYCLDATRMAASCGMTCWGKDGIVRLFSSVLFNE